MKKLNNMYLFIIGIVAYLVYNYFNRDLIRNSRWANSKYKGWKDVIIAQAQFETANFTSLNFTKYNNAFGMGCASKRKQIKVGCRINDSGGTYAIYSDAGQSLEDLFLYLDNANFPPARTQAEVDLISSGDPVGYYVNFISNRNYFEAPFFQYVQGVNKYYNARN